MCLVRLGYRASLNLEHFEKHWQDVEAVPGSKSMVDVRAEKLAEVALKEAWWKHNVALHLQSEQSEESSAFVDGGEVGNETHSREMVKAHSEYFDKEEERARRRAYRMLPEARRVAR